MAGSRKSKATNATRSRGLFPTTWSTGWGSAQEFVCLAFWSDSSRLDAVSIRLRVVGRVTYRGTSNSSRLPVNRPPNKLHLTASGRRPASRPTRRRKPGVCTNTLALPIAETDDDVLGIVEGEVLGTRFLEELLALVDRGEADDSARLTPDRDLLRAEVDRLVGSIAASVPADTLAPAIREREAEIARLNVALRTPRQAPPNIDKLRAALTQRAEAWKADLRDEPKVARLLLRRLVGPLTLWDESDAGLRWEAETKADELLDGLVHLGTSPRGTGRPGTSDLGRDSRGVTAYSFARVA
jgi:hypothetical protein